MFGVETLIEYGPLGLFALSFFESVFFPVPPDLVLLPLAMVNPGLSFWYAFLATSASVAGALAGYSIGRRAGRPLVQRYFPEHRLVQIELLFRRYGGWAVGIAAFTPLPFKLFTLAGGIFKVRLWPFLIASIMGRGARFFFEAGLVFFLGDKAESLFGRNFDLITMGITVFVIVLIWLIGKTKPGHGRGPG